MTVLSFRRWANHVAVASGAIERIPLLVLRMPRAQRSREAEALAVFRSAVGRITRGGDASAHARGSPHYAVALLAPGRAGRPPTPNDARAALERLAAAMALGTGITMQRGWWPLVAASELAPLGTLFAAALERGRRERERHDLLATVGHELRTPLTSIRGYVETLLEDDLDAATSRRFLQTVQRETVRLGRLVDGMLEFSMLDLSAPSAGACDAGEAMACAVDAIVPLARRRGIRVVLDPPQAATLRIDADACSHALLNVLENAVKYGRPGGRVVLGAVVEGGFAQIAVDDDGPGVALAERSAIFARGVRGQATEACVGAGLGLAIVKTIVTRAGGEATVEPSPLGGARFVLRLPVVARAESGRAAS